MCHLDEMPRPTFEPSLAAKTDLVAAGVYAAALARAAQRDDDAGWPTSWRRVHAILFSQAGLCENGLASRIEEAARRLGHALDPRPRSVADAEEIRGFIDNLMPLVDGIRKI